MSFLWGSDYGDENKDDKAEHKGESKEFQGSPIFKEMEADVSYKKLLGSSQAKRELFAWLVREQGLERPLIVDFVAFRTVGEAGEWLKESAVLDLQILEDKEHRLFINLDQLQFALEKIKPQDDNFGYLTFTDKGRVKPSSEKEASDKYSETAYKGVAPGGPS